MGERAVKEQIPTTQPIPEEELLAVKSKTQDREVIYQRTQRISSNDSLFYIPVTIQGSVEVKGLVDSGSMACTINEHTEKRLIQNSALLNSSQRHTSVILVGCGGKQVEPKCEYDLHIELLKCKMIVPVLVVPGQSDDIIIGSGLDQKTPTILFFFGRP